MARYTLKQLSYFRAVGEAGSVAGAAAKMNVSAPSISVAISQLEQEFGLPLFVRRHAQGLALTGPGRRMLDQAKLVLQEAEHLSALAGDLAGVVRGPLAVGCLLTFAQMVLPGLRKGFEGAFPEVQFHQHELNQVEIFSQLRRAELDLALSYDLDIPKDLRFTALLELTPFVLVGADHPLADRDQVSAQDLRDYPMVLLDLPLSSDYFLSFFSGLGVKPYISERTRDMAVMRSLVANGYGYSIANIQPLSPQSPDGKPLRYLPLVGGLRPMQMGILTTQEGAQGANARAFIAYANEVVEAGGLTGALFDNRREPTKNFQES